jgi:hypothetical protein
MQRLDDEATLDADEERLYEHYKEEFRAQEQLLQQRLLERFQTECPPDMSHPLVALASLQKLSREMGDREQLGMAFLELMNVASFAQTRDINYTRRFAAAIFATVQRTADCIPEQRLDRYAHTHSFKIDQKNERMAMRADAAVSLSWAHLPSGLLALVDQLSRLKVAATQQIKKGRTHLIILIDEGDAYLHLDWQRKYINIVNDFFGDLKDRYKKKNVTIQIVIASHSLVLAGDVANTMVTNLQEARSDVRTFAAPLDQLAFRSFKSYSVGEFATRKINLLHSKILAREIDEDDRVLIDQIGDQGVRNALIRAIDGPNTKAGDVT